MKKLITLLLALAMVFSLCACGGGSDTPKTAEPQTDNSTPATAEPEATVMTKEEMLAAAVEMDDYAEEMKDNKLRAEAKYIGNIYLLTGGVSNIESNCVDVGDFTVPLPAEDIIQLTSGQRITVVGKIDSLSAENSQQSVGGNTYTETNYHGVMSNGYIVADTFELSGTLIFYYKDLITIDGRTQHNYGDESYWSFGLDMVDNNVTAVGYSMKEDIPVEHVAGQNVETITISGQELKYKDRITVSAKVFCDNGYILKDVKLISVDN